MIALPESTYGSLNGRSEFNVPSLTSSSGAAATQAIAVTKSPDRCGGDACLGDTRIPIWVLVNFRRLGGSDADLLRNYPDLTQADLEVAWSYQATNTEEIEAAIRQNEDGESNSAE